ncbi:MAG: Lpg1974 family pore-forming outer membrane protein [Gemmataceae bacterium]
MNRGTWIVLASLLFAQLSQAQTSPSSPSPAPPPGATPVPFPSEIPAQPPELMVPPPRPLPPPPPPLRSEPPPIYIEPVTSFPVEPRLLQRSVGGSPGWFLDLDLAILFPDVRTRTTGSGNVFGSGTDFDLNADVLAGFTLGYRFNTQNAFLYSYRGFSSEGRPDPDGVFFDDIRTHLDMNDLSWIYQYVFNFRPDRWRVAGEVGARLSTVYYSLTTHTEFPIFAAATSPFGEIDMRGSSDFVGAGPTVGLSSNFELTPGLSLFAHTDFAALFGEQEFRVRTRSQFPGSPTFVTTSTDRHGNTAEALRVMAGLNWAPARTPRFAFQIGYQFEYWWNIGKFDDGRDDLMLNGLFFRMRYSF